jgi:hypothetical protein
MMACRRNYIAYPIRYASIYEPLKRRRDVSLNKMTFYLGILLVIIAIIVGAVRYSNTYDFGVSYGAGYGLYFYGLVGIIGLIGIIIAAWSYIKK